MAFDKETGLKGGPKRYRLNANVKRYTLKDQGFQETKSGNFQFVRSLNTAINNKQGTLLKIVVASDFSGLKMSTTTANGLKTVDVYGNANMSKLVEQLEYLLNHFVEQQVLEEA